MKTVFNIIRENYLNMAKLTGPKGKLVRRFGVNIYGTPKYDQLLQRRSHKPGQHGATPTRRKVSDYALQLIEKQKLRHSYCLLEKQFRRVFRKAQQMSGITGDNLLILLETRLDSLICRAGLGNTMMQARQLINHGHIRVNERKVDIASYQIKTGDIVSIRDNEKTRALITQNISNARRFTDSQWFTLTKSTLSITVNRLPGRDEIQSPADEKMIIEFYSK